MAQDAWLINPIGKSKHRKGVKRKMAKRKRNAKGRFVKGNSPRKHRKSSKRRRVTVSVNSPKKRRKHRRNSPTSHRRHRRNPGRGIMGTFTGLAIPVLYAGAGFIGTRFVSGMVIPAIGIGNPLAQLAIKGASAYLLAYGAKMVLGSKAFEPVFIGGMVDVVNDVVRTYIAPTIPALAGDGDYPQISYEDISAYPEISAYDNVGAYETVSEDSESEY